GYTDRVSDAAAEERRGIHMITSSLARKTAFIFIVFVGSLVTITGLLFYQNYERSSGKQLEETLGMVIQSNVQNTEEVFSRIDLMLDALCTSDAGMKEKLEGYNGQLPTIITSFHDVINVLENHLQIALEPTSARFRATLFIPDDYPVADKISVWSGEVPLSAQDNVWVYNSHGIQNVSWYRQAVQDPGKTFWYAASKETSAVELVKALEYYEYSATGVEHVKIGVLKLVLDVSWISDIFDSSELTESAQMMLVKEDGKLIHSDGVDCTEEVARKILSGKAGTESGRLQKMVVHEKSALVHCAEIGNGLFMINIVPQIIIANQLSTTARIVFTVFVAFLILLIVVIVLLTKMVVRPITKLSDYMRKGTFPTESALSVKGGDEIAGLYESFERLHRKVQQQIEEIYATEAKKQKLELDALQAQMNPHFLYNVLNSIGCIALMRRQEDLADALSQLEGFCRYHISSPDHMVTLEEELEVIEDYINLQKFCCGDKVHLNRNIMVKQPDRVKLPKMIVQPLLENSIKYGTDAVSNEVEIKLCCWTEQEMLCITVEDSGKRRNLEELNNLLTAPATTVKKTRGFGIRNIHQRLHLVYGARACFIYLEGSNGGTVASIRLPLQE
nr:histidine kinase [Acetatifactor sp.]